MKDYTVNLEKKIHLTKIDKIIIATEKFALSYSPKINKEISDKNIINEIINTLRSAKEVPVCDTRPQYTITFYKNNKPIARLGFFIDNNWYFLRLDSSEKQKDYEPNKDFIEMWRRLRDREK